VEHDTHRREHDNPVGNWALSNGELDRGVVAVKVTGGVYVGWRMMGYEYTGTDSDTSDNSTKTALC